MLIDDVSREGFVSALGTTWQTVSDRVLGGISTATLRVGEHAGRRWLRLSGEVWLENNGGLNGGLTSS